MSRLGENKMEPQSRPIIFSTDMVRAILREQWRKTQTRRVIRARVNERPGDWSRAIQLSDGSWSFWYPDRPGLEEFANLAYPNGGGIKCPYGEPGDYLWVRETWRCAACYDNIKPSELPLSSRRHIDYRANNHQFLHSPANGKWRPSIFMPRWASRITLSITDVCAERLQDISETDAQHEGWLLQGHPIGRTYDPVSMSPACQWLRRLWDSLNAKRGFGWDVNPWVWVVGFEVMWANGKQWH